MAKYYDPEFISFQGHNKITTICRATISEKDQNIAEKYLLQLKISRRNNNEMNRSGRDNSKVKPTIPVWETHTGRELGE